MASDYELLSATRWDPKLLEFDWNNDEDGPSAFFLLPYHFHRLLLTADLHRWTEAKLASYKSFKARCLEALNNHGFIQSLAYRLRITLTQQGHLKVAIASAIQFVSDPMAASLLWPSLDNLPDGESMALYLDREPTSASIFTETKTTSRSMYDQARERAGIAAFVPGQLPTSDVILHNHQGLITETSVCNIAFLREDQWITPPATTGGYSGVIRRWLLEHGRIHEAKVQEPLTTDSIKDGEWALVFNGVQGCRLGRVIRQASRE